MSRLMRVASLVLLLLLSSAASARALPDTAEAGTPPALKLTLLLADPNVAEQDIADADLTDLESTVARGGRVLISGGHQEQRTADLQFELPLVPDQRWVLWMARDPIDMVRVTGLDGIIQTKSFFTPAAEEGLIPVGYAFALPGDAIALQGLRLELHGAIRSAPTPRILSEEQALRLASREFALACVIYAALLTLLIASLVLYPAVRDRMFLLYSAYLTMALLFVAAASGHLYAMPGGHLLGGMGARGFWWVVLMFNAVAMLALTRFAETHASQRPWIRGLDRVAIVMALLSLMPLLPLDAVTNSLQSITTVAWSVAMAAGIVATVDGARRGVHMTVAATVALVLLLVAALAYEAMQRAWLGDTMLTRHGYLLVLVMLAVIMFIGLSSRIGQVRQRLEDETIARLQSDMRLDQERAQAGFAQVLQERLRSATDEDVVPTAFRLLGEHARKLTGADAAVVVGSGYMGHELILVRPDGQAARFAQEIRIARNAVRTHAYNADPVHIRLDGADETESPERPLRAIIPIRLEAPSWAALVIPASGPQGFEPGVLAALLELGRVAVLQTDQAYAAIQLRRTAEHDSLTGTQNRRSLDQTLASEFKSNRVDDAVLTVLFVDIDLFKRINDRLGHACGDFCIRKVASCLRGELRPSDTMGRYGGDEFLVLLPGRDAAAARIIAERLRNAVASNQVHWQGANLQLTVSIGLAARRTEDLMPATLLERADKALYAAKADGRNRVCVAPALD